VKWRISRQLVPAARRAEIAALAEAVADEHAATGRVEPAEIARAQRITTSFGDYGEAFDGMLELQRGRWHIYCNRRRAGGPDAPRARFTLAHELGHYFLDAHRNALAAGGIAAHRSQCDHESPILAEQEADHFAAHLLLPTGRFLAKAKAATPGLGGVLAVAEHFGTSITATAIRFAAADAAVCAVVKWSWRGYAWRRLSASILRAGLRMTFRSPADLPADGPTRRALAREDPPEAGWFEAGTVASAWFPRVGPGEPRDWILIEQAIPLGRFGVLTFLSPPGGARTLRTAPGP
jgi:hypothetical protein